MKQQVQGVLLVLVGGAVARIVLSGAYVNYVKASMRGWLLASAVVLVVFGVLAVLDGIRSDRAEVQVLNDHDHGHGRRDDHGDGHDHAHGGESMRSAYLLLVPVAAIFLIAPGPLGAFTASREAAAVAAPVKADDYPPLPAGDPVEVPLDSYAARAVWDSGRTLAGREVELLGFVTPTDDGWVLTRLTITCCAADTVATKVKPTGQVPDFPANTWVEVTGRYVSGGGEGTSSAVPWVHVDDVKPVAAPADPYL